MADDKLVFDVNIKIATYDGLPYVVAEPDRWEAHLVYYNPTRKINVGVIPYVWRLLFPTEKYNNAILQLPVSTFSPADTINGEVSFKVKPGDNHLLRVQNCVKNYFERDVLFSPAGDFNGLIEDMYKYLQIQGNVADSLFGNLYDVIYLTAKPTALAKPHIAMLRDFCAIMNCPAYVSGKIEEKFNISSVADLFD